MYACTTRYIYTYDIEKQTIKYDLAEACNNTDDLQVHNNLRIRSVSHGGSININLYIKYLESRPIQSLLEFMNGNQNALHAVIIQNYKVSQSIIYMHCNFKCLQAIQ